MVVRERGQDFIDKKYVKVHYPNVGIHTVIYFDSDGDIVYQEITGHEWKMEDTITSRDENGNAVRGVTSLSGYDYKKEDYFSLDELESEQFYLLGSGIKLDKENLKILTTPKI